VLASEDREIRHFPGKSLAAGEVFYAAGDALGAMDKINVGPERDLQIRRYEREVRAGQHNRVYGIATRLRT
jgi:hypothetical protein